MSDQRRELVRFVREMNASGGAYHTIRLADGLVLEGVYDMAAYLSHYGFPDDLSGWTVLDVGTATGFFALEFERRGAQVTAIDLWQPSRFSTLREGVGSSVRYVQKSVFDLDADFGVFDLVFCGSLLPHLSDIFGAIRKLREVCRRRVIVASAIDDDARCTARPMCEFAGAYDPEGDYWTCWTPNLMALSSMLTSAGFADVEEVSRFELVAEPGRGGHRILHAVVHAVAPTDAGD